MLPYSRSQGETTKVVENPFCAIACQPLDISIAKYRYKYSIEMEIFGEIYGS